MIDIKVLFISVFTLFLFMIPGFILRKLKLIDGGFAKNLSLLVLYIAQIALLLHSYIIEFKPSVLSGILQVFIVSFLIHCILFIVARSLFKKAPQSTKKVLQFGLIFSNAGYMGIPVISDVFGAELTIYATIYIVWFNIFAFSLGRLIYTGDKKYMSVKEAIINPAVVPIIIGFIIFITGGGTWIQNTIKESTPLGLSVKVFYDVCTTLKNMVAPLTMLVIGARLADIKFKGILKDKYMYPFVALRLLILPAIIFVLLKVLNVLNLIDTTAMSILLILSSTPAAALTSMFAELYDGDSPYAGKLVALTTVLSVLTMPLVALLLLI